MAPISIPRHQSPTYVQLVLDRLNAASPGLDPELVVDLDVQERDSPYMQAIHAVADGAR